MTYISLLTILIISIFLIRAHNRVVANIQRVKEGCFVYLPSFSIPKFISLNNREFDLETIPTHFFILLFLHEDDLFLTHKGFNIPEIFNALASITLKKRLRGGSSITQQTVKNIFTKGKRSFRKKLIETFITMIVEQRLTKEEILYLYLSTIKFGFPISGLPAITKYLKIKDIAQIQPTQSELIVTLLPSPTNQIINLKNGGIAKYNYNYSYEKLLILARIFESSIIKETDYGFSDHIDTLKTLLETHRPNFTFNLSNKEEAKCITTTASILHLIQESINHIALGFHPNARVEFFLCQWQLAFLHLLKENRASNDFPTGLSQEEEKKIIYIAKKNGLLGSLSREMAKLQRLEIIANAIELEEQKDEPAPALNPLTEELIAKLLKSEINKEDLHSTSFIKSFEQFFSIP